MSRHSTFAERMGGVFDAMRGSLRETLSPSEYAQLRDTFVFHMTEWEQSLGALARVAAEPGKATAGQSYDAAFAFLYDVQNHLRAASRLVGADVGDPFADDEVYEILARAEKCAAVAGRGPEAAS